MKNTNELLGQKYKHGPGDISINPLLSHISYQVERIKDDGKILCRFYGDGTSGIVEFDKEDLNKLETIN